VKFLVLEKGMTVEQLMANKEWFHSLDKNGDGKLQPAEMDGALKQI
jgi:Ca2+-binding EF-hand superfamily protein